MSHFEFNNSHIANDSFMIQGMIRLYLDSTPRGLGKSEMSERKSKYNEWRNAMTANQRESADKLLSDYRNGSVSYDDLFR